MEGGFFGPFQQYLQQETVTDLDYNGTQLWITDLVKGRYLVEHTGITQDFIIQFSHRLANEMGMPFHQQDNMLEAESDGLRISILHESAAVSGRSVSIRKAQPRQRMNQQEMIRTGYCQQETLALLIHCIKVRMNVVFCGEPGVGKTECAKFFSQFIPGNERVITIEDNLELHYQEINPGKDCVSLKIDEQYFPYTKAIKCSLRQNPRWIMLSEARSREVKYLLESWSTGVYGFTTLHTDDVRKIPDRILNMMEIGVDANRLENQVYEFVNLGILIRKKAISGGTQIRYLDQVCFFTRENGVNQHTMIVENGELTCRQLPEPIERKMRRAQIEEPFVMG